MKWELHRESISNYGWLAAAVLLVISVLLVVAERRQAEAVDSCQLELESLQRNAESLEKKILAERERFANRERELVQSIFQKIEELPELQEKERRIRLDQLETDLKFRLSPNMSLVNQSYLALLKENEKLFDTLNDCRARSGKAPFSRPHPLPTRKAPNDDRTPSDSKEKN